MSKFTVGGVQFEPVRRDHPRIPNTPMWLVKVVDTGEVWEAGTGGIPNDSRPKMQAELERLFELAHKRDEADWRRALGLS